MQKHNCSYETAYGTMKAIADYGAADFDTLGITPEQFHMTYAPVMWQNTQRRAVTGCLDALLFGTTDKLGLPRISLPAEFIAAVIATFVAPCNRQVACHWMAEQRATGARAIDLSSRGIEATAADPVAASQLFALVCQLSETDRASQVRQTFAKRIGAKIEEFQTPGVE